MAPSTSTGPSDSCASSTGAQRTKVETSAPRIVSELPLPWKLMFKNDSWLQQILWIPTPDSPYNESVYPIPCVGGVDLPRLWGSKNGTLSAYLFLLIQDNSWGNSYEWYGLKEKFFDSLLPHKFDPKHFEVTFDSGIILNVHDVLVDQVEMAARPMRSPSDFFGQEDGESGVFTYVNYYNPWGPVVTGPERVGPELIKGIEGVPWDDKEAIRELCSIELKFRDGAPNQRWIRAPTVETRIKPIYDETIYDEDCGELHLGVGRLIGVAKAGPNENAWNDYFIAYLDPSIAETTFQSWGKNPWDVPRYSVT